MKKNITTFAEIAPLYLAERIVSQHYASNVARIAGRVGTLSVERVNRWLTKRVEEVSGLTARAERGVLLTLWNWAYDRGPVDAAPRGILKMKARRKPTKAWTLGQLKNLIAAAQAKRGTRLRGGADLGEFLACWILVGYETGARFGDVMAFTRDHLDGDTLSWTQSKTGDPIVRPLTPACLTLIDAMLAKSPDGRILGWVCRRRMAMRHMRLLLDSVGIGGSSKWLRRSGATHCEMEKAGTGRLHLGHRSPALFEQAYCDWSQLRTKTPRTPAIL
jgi:integrase